ncbi:pseudouridine synthase [Lactobacillus delbrueckii]|uniref:pseudouridine synthase n=1 Tax=Lactobacillus delbrueckii TaxID=1584 RepID=UPI0011090A7E|nr:pseudouridine synthase [Lactobacillus delbrueckii]MCD5436380.1 rRNA pseudouridine synthase [Lactobacillus delbrueckii subsp. lactis]MCD5500883.1 rRNA pseudouridine synthase [Lactobacillus delbrueckii subsp. lactis]MCD5537216.1 rRNA pseudouridine synthase [Lactobacillus delbrueckii subsp. lactis]MCD5542730.1 rRNA pseudouridine synthase [Lactobacillus delbrueckii subsp. lactis]MCT3515452.1 rRNA pseudouridine synthase [Lactobacillus delbrueckii subsp. lactis]
MLRLDKFLANMKVGSRSQVHEIIKAGQVTVNGKVCRSAKQKVKEDAEVLVNGQAVVYQQYHYFLLNKPDGVLSATEDSQQKTVLDLLKDQDRYQKIAPVGRLDKDTTGLLLLTNDGQLAHQLLAPEYHVPKTYYALLAGVADEETAKAIAAGLTLKDGTELKPGQLKILRQDKDQEQSEIEITITEGKYHQVKRMFASQGMKVLKLKRLSMGPLTLPADLAPGSYRPLIEEELAALKQVAL